ncbi:futalosine hydrolase [Paenibacillus sp. FJAT-26967]|uniref:futalosine hydrolase n=1 Tax=Paenibacillus sp. FJAT-26967 TaxID=1729690 RepID=UPI000838646A|nr:futalosine hydrolase [Paenibacillus sp. FJAT-26967]
MNAHSPQPDQYQPGPAQSSRILIMTPVAAEQEAVLRGLQGEPRFDVAIAGVGPVAAAITTTSALAAGSYGLVINMGIAGGFLGRAEIGSLVVASEIIAADLGAQSPGGFISLDELGFGTARVPAHAGLAARVADALRASGLTAGMGAVLTLSTVTGTAEAARELAARIPEAAAEGMEGFGVASAAYSRGIPALEIRSISNAVGPRDKAAWRIKDALAALEQASSILREVL